MKKELGIICIIFQAYAMESPESNRNDINGPANSTSWRDESYLPSESRNSQEDIRSQEEILETNGKPLDWNISGISIDSGTSFVSGDVVHEHSFFAIDALEGSEEFSIIKSNNIKDIQKDIQHPNGAEWFQISSSNEFFAYLKLKKLYKDQDTNSPLWQLCLSQGYDPHNEPVPYMEQSYFIEHFFQRHDFPIQAFNAVCGRCIEKLKNSGHPLNMLKDLSESTDQVFWML